MGFPIQVVFDSADPGRLAQFWAAALHYVVQPPPPGYASWEDLLREMGVPEEQWTSRSAVVDPEGSGPRIFFQRVPEPKAAKNRVHLDVRAGGGLAGAARAGAADRGGAAAHRARRHAASGHSTRWASTGW